MATTRLFLSTLFLRSSNPGGFIVWCVIGLCGGLYLFFNGFRLLQRRHLILNTPISKIRSASLGMVELSGLAVGPYSITAPVTARPCYFYRTLVWEWKQSGKNKQWVKVAAECMHVPFFLDDNSGRVMVDPRGAELDLHRDFQQEFCDSFFTTKQEVPPNVNALLSRHGIFTTNKIKVEEFCIKPKNALFLLGTLAENPGFSLHPQPIHDEEYHTLGSINTLFSNPLQVVMGTTTLAFAAGAGESSTTESLNRSEHSVGERLIEAGVAPYSMFANAGVDHAILEEEFRHAASAQVIKLSLEPASNKIADMTQQQKVAAALAKAGISSPTAWAAAGVANANASAKADLPSSNTVSPLDGFDSHPSTVIMRGKNNPTFLISWRSQRDVVRTLGWKCALMIWGGPALVLLSLYGLLNLTHVI
jgi:hypothetical protein